MSDPIRVTIWNEFRHEKKSPEELPMVGAMERVHKAFAHEVPDRTPLFEIFSQFHPIYWDICGRSFATDAAMHWDALAEGVSWEELVEGEAQARFQVNRFFGVDIIHVGGNRPPEFTRPVKTGEKAWTLTGVEYVYNERTKLVERAVALADSQKQSEAEVKRQIDQWDGNVADAPEEAFAVLRRIRELADAEGLDWAYMAEIGAGTGVAFYPPFMLMWLLAEPDWIERWLQMQKAAGFARTREMLRHGCEIVAIGGDVSCDKGPFISPTHYRRFILPVIQEQVALIHDAGALAVYTADGNHWDIKEDFFLNSNVDGYKEVDKAAGMTWERLIEEGIDRRVCIIGNLDARYTLCLGTPQEVQAEVIECLKFGQTTPGGHILHASHSVHEDVKVENYYAAINAYRDFFGMELLPI